MINKMSNSTLAIIFFIFLGGIMRLALSSHMQVMNVDATGYFKSGVTFTDYFDGLSAFWSPVYPLLCILLNYVWNNIEMAGKVISILAGTTLIFIVFLFTRRLYDSLSAVIAAIMITYMPVMV